MTAAPRHPRQAKEGNGPQSKPAKPPQKKAGRPKGPPSTIVNLRIPLDLLAQLDRYIDGLEVQTGLRAFSGDPHTWQKQAITVKGETRVTRHSSIFLSYIPLSPS
jgi:hypothetical protein